MVLHHVFISLLLCAALVTLGEPPPPRGPGAGDVVSIQPTYEDPQLDFENMLLNLDNVPDDKRDRNSMDVQDVDTEKLRRKLDEVLMKYGDAAAPAAAGAGKSRRQASLNYNHGVRPTRAAERFRIKRVALDMMVQLLYMGRQRVRLMEASPFFDSTSLGFRIAYAFKKARRIWGNLELIYRMSNEKIRVWRNVSYHFILHHRAARLHVDLTYIYWLVIRMDIANNHLKSITGSKRP